LAWQVITLHTWWGQVKNGGVLNGTQNYGENHYDKFYSDDSTHAEVHACQKVAQKYNDKKHKKNKKVFNLIVVRTSRSGSNLGNSRLCERCVLDIEKISNNSGIKIKKIYYSTENGDIHKTSLHKMLNMNDHHITSYLRNKGYKSVLNTCHCCNHT
jgi:hypothetical protein